MSKFEFELERRQAARDHDAVMDLRAILVTSYGRRFFKYIFDTFDVGEYPEIGTENDILRDQLGFLRAGKSLFSLAAQANPEVTGQIMAEVEKERYEISRAENETPRTSAE